MAAKYGTPREVYKDEKQKGGMKRSLDHFEWAASGNDVLKLVDRSEFYGVFCLILANNSVNENVIAKRKVTNPQTAHSDALVEAVVNDKGSAQDSNEDDDHRSRHRPRGEEARRGDEARQHRRPVPLQQRLGRPPAPRRRASLRRRAAAMARARARCPLPVSVK